LQGISYQPHDTKNGEQIFIPLTCMRRS